MVESFNNKERLDYDDTYRLRVGNKQKAYRDLLRVGPNLEPGFFLPIDYYESNLSALVSDLSSEGEAASFKFLYYKNQSDEYLDGFEIDIENRRFIIMRDSFFEGNQDINIKIVHAETIVLSILDQSSWPSYDDNKFSRVHEYVSNLLKDGDIDDLTALALGLDLGDIPKEFLGSKVYKPGHNAYWNLMVKKTIESCRVDDSQELKTILSTIGLTTIDTSPRISEIDNPDINIRTEIDSLKQAIKRYQG